MRRSRDYIYNDAKPGGGRAASPITLIGENPGGGSTAVDPHAGGLKQRRRFDIVGYRILPSQCLRGDVHGAFERVDP